MNWTTYVDTVAKSSLLDPTRYFADPTGPTASHARSLHGSVMNVKCLQA